MRFCLLGQVDSIADVGFAGVIDRCFGTCVRGASGVLLLLICDIIVVDRSCFHRPWTCFIRSLCIPGFALTGTLNSANLANVIRSRPQIKTFFLSYRFLSLLGPDFLGKQRHCRWDVFAKTSRAPRPGFFRRLR